MNDIEGIKNYILFLKREMGLYVSLHPSGDETLITMSELMVFNIHEHPYCVLVKTKGGTWHRCLERQRGLRERCREGAFCDCCYAGVSELVYPIRRGEEVTGFLSVSGYRGAVPPPAALAEAAATLRAEMPSRGWVDTLVVPLLRMLELAYLRAETRKPPAPDLMEEILQYVKRHHREDLTLSEVSRQFGCSRSYISHRFSLRAGCSFREYLTSLRLEDAMALLRYSDLTVTEIALAVGFGDSTYFSSVFRRRVGVSPSAYRRAGKVDEKR